jgi:hypothetical protein
MQTNPYYKSFALDANAMHDIKPNECHICHEEYIQPATIASLTVCNHAFHESCITQWFNYSISCPICRKQAGSIAEAEPRLNMYQYIILFLSLSSQPSSPVSELQTYQETTLDAIAFTCVFLHLLADTYKTAAEYNEIKQQILDIKPIFEADGQRLSASINVNNRTAITRELRYRKDLLRSQLLQALWTAQDPYHIDDPPYVPGGRQLFQHPYLLRWREKIVTQLDTHGIIIQ